MMEHLQTFQVYPAIPKALSFLEILSRNLWWSWNYDAVELFRRIDPRLWDESGRNPLVFAIHISQDRLAELETDRSFLAHLDRVKKNYIKMTEISKDETNIPPSSVIAYFSMEFGLHESVPIFAGGLGVLAGDHLKAASDMGIPLVGIGIMYQNGYFRQYLDQNGWQQEEYPETDLYHLPITRAKDRKGKEVTVSVTGPTGDIHAVIWKIRAGRVPLFLLDTNIQENSAEARHITSRLYAAEGKIRLAQEILLGFGGMKALMAMDIFPAVCHMNEGHSAFSCLERLALTMEKYNVDLKTAMEIVPRTTVFTTHTPVPAGHEEFHVDMVRPYLKPLEERLGISTDDMIAMGKAPNHMPEDKLSMFILGARMAVYRNGVSKLHKRVAQKMWQHVWPGRPVEEVPISHITNGVHSPSWISHELSLLYDRYIGPDWAQEPCSQENISRLEDIYAEELWRAHCMSRSHLIRTCRGLMVRQYSRRNAPKETIKNAETVLDQDILTIGFARRFAAYKRANLLLQDPERFEAMICSPEHPVQFIFAGKAHPSDNDGKQIIKQLVEFARRPSVRHRIVFIEDYDIHLARHLVQGADVWLNTPRRPMEACGTSGMKAALNGVLNVSILDGWWCEGYNSERGWRIGNGEEYMDPVFQDAVESQALYNVLENEVIPCFYQRKNGDIPATWLKMMRASMKMGMQQFSSHRMVGDYHSLFYRSAAEQLAVLTENNAEKAKHLARMRESFSLTWNQIRIEEPVREVDGPFRVGETFNTSVTVHLGEISPDDVDVELYYGRVKTFDVLEKGETEPMERVESSGVGTYRYRCRLSCHHAGRYAFTVRITPRGDDWIKFTPGFITWA